MPSESLYTQTRKQYGPRRPSPLLRHSVVVIAGTLGCYFGTVALLGQLEAGPPVAERASAKPEQATQDPAQSPSLARIVAQAYEEGSWRKSIGDLSLSGSLFAGGYALAAICCFIGTGWPGERFRRPSPLAWYWCLLTALLLCLGANRQVRLQRFIADLGETYVRAKGWSTDYGSMQIQWLAIGTAICCGVYLILFLRLAKTSAAARLALSALLLLFVLPGIQAVSYEPLTRMLGTSLGPVTLIELAEGVGIATITLSAALYWPHRQMEKTYILQ